MFFFLKMIIIIFIVLSSESESSSSSLTTKQKVSNSSFDEKPITIADREGQDLFHNKSQYGVTVASICGHHNLSRAKLQKLVLPYQSESDSNRLEIFGIACYDYLQRVHAQLFLLFSIQLNIFKNFQLNQT